MKKLYSMALVLFAILLLCSINVFADGKRVNIEGNTFIEMEDYNIMRVPMTTYKDPTASGGVYVSTTTGASQMNSPKRDYEHLTYDISVPDDDSYFVWLRIRTPDHDHMYVSFDDGVYRNKKKDTAAKENLNEWTWILADKYWLTAGDHTLEIRYSTKTVCFDAICITDDYKFLPDGAKPAIIPPDELYQRDENGNITNLLYSLPTYLPPDEHPRLLFRKSDIETIKNSLMHEQNIVAYNDMLADANYETDGKLKELQYGQLNNLNTNIALKIESCAFLYQITGDKNYGYEAISVAKNFIESMMIDETSASSTGRTMMQAIWSTSLCYDWCYDLLTDEDKDFFISYMLLNTRFSEPGYPPIYYGIKDGTISEIVGHNLEFQSLGALMAVAVATYDEIPDYYNILVGRLQQYVIPGISRFNTYYMYNEGTDYGMYRHYYEILNNYIFKGMGYDNVYYEKGYSSIGYMYLRQPDGEKMREGDDPQYYRNGYVATDSSMAYFLLGNLTKNPYYKTEYWRGKRTDVKTTNTPGHLTPVMWLIMNDVTVPCNRSVQDFPLTMYSGDDSGYLIARTSWEEGYKSDAVVCMMNTRTHFLKGHEHKDIGHFALYYKGLLAMDTGIYEGTSFVNSKGETITSTGMGTEQQYGYARQTIAHNSLLVYDPNEVIPDEDMTKLKTMDGGQKMSNVYKVMEIADFDTEKAKSAEVLSYNWGPDPTEPQYSYMKSDISYAYSDKVEDMQRSFMFFNFKDETYPAALIVFDSVKSSSPLFKKTWLMHSEEEPVIEGNQTTIVRTVDDYNGRLVNHTLLPEKNFSIEKIGQDYDGVSKYLVQGHLYEMKPKTDTAEVGNWRIEISNTNAEKQTYFLNVMQVEENNETIVPLEAKLVENTKEYVGVEINNHIAYFRKDGLSKSKNITINPGNSDAERFIVVTGLAEGKWTVYDEKGNKIAEEIVYEKRDSLSFTAKGGKFNLKYTMASGLTAPDYTVFALADQKDKGVDICIDGVFETFENPWLFVNNQLYIPVAEALDEFDVIHKTEADFIEGMDGVVRMNGILYAPKNFIESSFVATINYDAVASVANVEYNNRDHDRAKIFVYDEPDVAKIISAYTEGTTTAPAINSLDGNFGSYSCTLDDGSFTAILAEPEIISKIALCWQKGNERQEIFELYISDDGKSWIEVFEGKSDGVTNGFEYYTVTDKTKCKYVKVVCHGNTKNSYNSLCEIKVYKEVQ
ncbi:MAG: discoidin domain-containing protein [Clostridia bacterium]|nr:discoidin domain-containing protein [Clostridia bacterium]